MKTKLHIPKHMGFSESNAKREINSCKAYIKKRRKISNL